jgi:hypothetical protein
VFPSAFYLCMPYTEAIFLALAIWTILAARRSAWGWAALFAICTGLTRTQGCLLALPLAWELIRQWRNLTGSPIRRWAVVLVPLLPVTGLILFIACSKAITGWTTFDAQAATWQASYNLPWVILWHSWQHIRATSSLVEVLNLTLLLLFVGLFVIGVQRLPLSYSLYVAPQLALLTVRQTTFSPLGSVNRYLLVMFPIFVTLALLCSQRRHQFLWLSSSLALLATLFYLFLLGAFIA